MERFRVILQQAAHLDLLVDAPDAATAEARALRIARDQTTAQDWQIETGGATVESMVSVGEGGHQGAVRLNSVSVFWDLPQTQSFVEKCQDSMFPPVMVRTIGGEIVLANSTRSLFLSLFSWGQKFHVNVTDDAVALFDPTRAIEQLGVYDTVEQAFSAACARIGVVYPCPGEVPSTAVRNWYLKN